MNIFKSDDKIAPRDLSGKRVLITGGSRGIGLETARTLANFGAEVIILCRTESSAQEAINDIKNTISKPHLIKFELCDFTRLMSIKIFSRYFLKQYDRLDCLINTLSVINDHLELSEDGFELTLQINFLAPFLLINCLMPILKDGVMSRVIMLSSEIHHFGHIDAIDPFGKNQSNSFSAIPTYANTKLMTLLLMKQLVKITSSENITILCAESSHPPYPMHPKMQLGNIFNFNQYFKSIHQTLKKQKFIKHSQILIYCSIDPEIVHWNGFYISKKFKVKDSSLDSYNLDLATRIWRECEVACGMRSYPLNHSYYSHNLF